MELIPNEPKAAGAAGTDGKTARGPRSPNFPGIALADAIGKARKLYEKDKRALVSTKTVLAHLGFGENLSGASARVISALRQFGLLEDVSGQFRITETAARIFNLSDGAPERLQAIQAAAQKPAIYGDIFNHYRDGLPSDAALGDFLILNKKFNPASVDTFIRVFKASNEFAKLAAGGYTAPAEDGQSDFAVGDYVQWESQGVLQFAEPKKVTGISQDGEFVFVEGATTGIPADQISKAQPPVILQPMHKPLAGVSREVSSLEEGEAMLQWPANLSSDSVAELEDWLALVIKKLKRRYASDPK